MKFVTAAARGSRFPAVLSADGRRAIALCEAGVNFDSLEALARFATPDQLDALRALSKRGAAGAPLEALTLLPAIPAPNQEIIIMENNFVADGAPLPTYFYKKASFANVDGGRIPSYPGHVSELDYQAELCAVVAGDCNQLRPAEAEARIFGYLLINNVIARNLVPRHRRPYIATSLDGFLPMSSLLVTPDELPGEIRIRSYVNGEPRQDGLSTQAKFSFAHAIADLSRISVLRGGSILSLGTPAGSGRDQTPPRYLRSGDVVSCEAGDLLRVTNVVE